MLVWKPLDFASHNIHLQVSVEVNVSNVPLCAINSFTYSVTEAYRNANLRI